ncbi:MAG: hypothetical protein QW559_02310 [Candidatus Woesearchaeota archaeon]
MSEGIVSHISSVLSYLDAKRSEKYSSLVSDELKLLKEIIFIKEVIENSNYLESLDNFLNAATAFLEDISLFYPCLCENLREYALIKSVSLLDMLDSSAAKSKVAAIHEPWFAADIVINRPEYDPGFEEYAKKLETVRNWNEFEKLFVKNGKLEVKSPFWLAYTISKQYLCDREIREEFERRWPLLVERTKDAVAALLHYEALKGMEKNNGKSYEQSLESKLQIYPSEWYDQLKQKVQEKKWIDIKENKKELQKRQFSKSSYFLIKRIFGYFSK